MRPWIGKRQREPVLANLPEQAFGQQVAQGLSVESPIEGSLDIFRPDAVTRAQIASGAGRTRRPRPKQGQANREQTYGQGGGAENRVSGTDVNKGMPGQLQ